MEGHRDIKYEGKLGCDGGEGCGEGRYGSPVESGDFGHVREELGELCMQIVDLNKPLNELERQANERVKS